VYPAALPRNLLFFRPARFAIIRGAGRNMLAINFIGDLFVLIS
jgi:hypothetical protein